MATGTGKPSNSRENAPRALIYLRVSTKDQHPENQLAELREYAARSGWEVVEVITDMESGGKSMDERPGLEKVFRLAHMRKYDVLLFWSLDRLSREGTRETLGYLTTLDAEGIGWHSYTEKYLSSLGDFKDVVISLLSTLAKQERVRIGERVRAGLERAKASGKKLGRPKGARTKKPNKEAVAKMKAAQKLRDQGLSFGEIGKALGTTRQYAHLLCKKADGLA